jgi:hypothetical protein
MEQLKQTLDPLIDSLPEGIRDFWFLIVCVVALLVLLPIAWFQRRLITALVTGRRGGGPRLEEPPAEDLATYTPPSRVTMAPTIVPAGAKRLLVEGVSARIRLVVLAPLGTAATVDPSHAEEMLNQALWGLGTLAIQEKARIRIWPPQLSAQGFAATFHRMVHRPGPDGQPSNWVIAAGHTVPRPRPVLVGLALWTDEKTAIGRLVIHPHEWVSILRVDTAPTPATTSSAGEGLRAAPAEASGASAVSAPIAAGAGLDHQNQDGRSQETPPFPGRAGEPLED